MLPMNEIEKWAAFKMGIKTPVEQYYRFKQQTIEADTVSDCEQQVRFLYCTFINVKFERVHFLHGEMSWCKFQSCTFVDCRFGVQGDAKLNVDGTTSGFLFLGNNFANCVFENCRPTILSVVSCTLTACGFHDSEITFLISSEVAFHGCRVENTDIAFSERVSPTSHDFCSVASVYRRSRFLLPEKSVVNLKFNQCDFDKPSRCGIGMYLRGRSNVATN